MVRWNLKWIIVSVAALAVAAAGAAYMWSRLVMVHVAPMEKDVPIEVFGLGTVEAQIVSQIGFETAGTVDGAWRNGVYVLSNGEADIGAVAVQSVTVSNNWALLEGGGIRIEANGEDTIHG